MIRLRQGFAGQGDEEMTTKTTRETGIMRASNLNIQAVESRMLIVRGQHVLLDRDVAELYGVETRIVNQAVKRNAERFFDNYILELTPEECSRSQIVTLNGKRGSNLKYLPHAFTERGLYMLATVLKSAQAVEATHVIIETFAKVRELKRDLVRLHTETDKKTKSSLMKRFGETLTDIVMPDADTTETESSLEINFFIGKLKHTVRKVKKVRA